MPRASASVVDVAVEGRGIPPPSPTSDRLGRVWAPHLISAGKSGPRRSVRGAAQAGFQRRAAVQAARARRVSSSLPLTGWALSGPVVVSSRPIRVGSPEPGHLAEAGGQHASSLAVQQLGRGRAPAPGQARARSPAPRPRHRPSRRGRRIPGSMAPRTCAGTSAQPVLDPSAGGPVIAAQPGPAASGRPDDFRAGTRSLP